MHAAIGNVPKLSKKRTEKVLFSMPGPEYFRKDAWEEAFAETGIDVSFYACRKRSTDEILPWDFLDIGVTKNS